jgi:predicted nucleotidyltransferase component of viral defense system
VSFEANIEQRQEIMRNIAQEMSSEKAVLKGGTALFLCYGLDRHSEDMDFDAHGKLNFDKVKRIINNTFKKMNLATDEPIIKKNTDTTKRLMYHYELSDNSMGRAYPLKIEFSYRDAEEIRENDYTTVKGIKVYKIDALAKRKLNAFLDRTAARDIYDIDFLLRKHPSVFSEEMKNEIMKKTADELSGVLHDSKEFDYILKNVDADELALRLLENAGKKCR